MMEEELRQEAEGYFETSCPYSYADTEDDLKHDVTEAYMAGAEPREKRIKELEKENAELKSIADFQTSSNMDRYFQLKRSKEQLIKAKEIIKKIEKIVYSGENEIKRLSKIVDILAEAEQFLSEVEK